MKKKEIGKTGRLELLTHDSQSCCLYSRVLGPTGIHAIVLFCDVDDDKVVAVDDVETPVCLKSVALHKQNAGASCQTHKVVFYITHKHKVVCYMAYKHIVIFFILILYLSVTLVVSRES